MEFKNYFSRENLLSKYLRTGIALLAMAAIVGCAQAEILYAVPPKQNLSELIEVCEFAVREEQGLNDAVDKSMVEPILPVELIKGDIEAIEALKISADTMVQIESKNKYNVLLAPIGYPDSEETIRYIKELIEQLSLLYQGVNVGFSYLTFNVPVGIQHVDGYSTLSDGSEAHALWLKANEVTPTNDIVFIVKADIDMMGSGGTGTDGNRYAVVAGNTEHTLFSTGHETGHNLKLSDGYSRFYGNGGLSGTELFTRTQHLRSDVGDEEIVTIAQNEGAFNPMQRAIMNNYIQRVTNQ